MNVGRLLILIAVVLFVLAAFGATAGQFGVDLVALGSPFFAVGHLIP